MTDEIFKFHPESPISGCIGKVVGQYAVLPGGPPVDGWWFVEFDEPQIDRTGMRSYIWDASESALRRLK